MTHIQEIFKKYINKNISLTPAECELILSQSISKNVRKKQFILREGDVCRHVAFVSKGCLRMYRLRSDDTEHILLLALENWWICDRESAVKSLPSKNNIDALEDSEILIWSKDNFDKFINKIPELKSWYIQQLDERDIASQNRIFTNISFSAEEKYADFINQYPDLVNRVSLHIVASYLGLSRETLSRIRKRSAFRH